MQMRKDGSWTATEDKTWLSPMLTRQRAFAHRRHYRVIGEGYERCRPLRAARRYNGWRNSNKDAEQRGSILQITCSYKWEFHLYEWRYLDARPTQTQGITKVAFNVGLSAVLRKKSSASLLWRTAQAPDNSSSWRNGHICGTPLLRACANIEKETKSYSVEPYETGWAGNLDARLLETQCDTSWAGFVVKAVEKFSRLVGNSTFGDVSVTSRRRITAWGWG